MYVETIVRESLLYKEDSESSSFLTKLRTWITDVKSVTISQYENLKQKIMSKMSETSKTVLPLEKLMNGFQNFVTSIKSKKIALENSEMLLALFHYYMNNFGNKFVYSTIEGSPSEKEAIVKQLKETTKVYYEKHKDSLNEIDELKEKVKNLETLFSDTQNKYSKLVRGASSNVTKSLTWLIIYLFTKSLLSFMIKKVEPSASVGFSLIKIISNVYKIIKETKFSGVSLFLLFLTISCIVSLYKIVKNTYEIAKAVKAGLRLIDQIDLRKLEYEVFYN